MQNLIFGLNDSFRINRAWLYKEPKVSFLQAKGVGLGIRGYDRPWFYSHWGNIFHWILLFSRSASATNISIISKQECIPVRCILSTAVAILGGLPMGVPAQEGDVFPGGGIWLGSVCTGRYLPRGCLPRGVYTSPCGQTDTCENITFPQLLLWTVKTHETWDLTPLPPDTRHGTYPLPSPFPRPTPFPVTDISWSSLETCSNLVTWGPTPSTDI